MTGDTGLSRTARSFQIHGGECVIHPTADAVDIDQSLLRHHHPLAWLFVVAAALTGGYSLATGWRYTAGTGELIGWPYFLFVTGLLLGIPIWRRIVDRYEGYTNANTIQLSDIEAVTLTNTEIRWYFKTRKTVPVCEIRYRTDDQTHRHRFKLPLRSGQEEVEAAIDVFEESKIKVEKDLTNEDIKAPLEG